MARMLTETELKHLTIPRLQSLLKVWRARAHARSTCDCCGESYQELYGADNDHAIAGAIWYRYVERIKDRLHELQH